MDIGIICNYGHAKKSLFKFINELSKEHVEYYMLDINNLRYLQTKEKYEINNTQEKIKKHTQNHKVYKKTYKNWRKTRFWQK